MIARAAIGMVHPASALSGALGRRIMRRAVRRFSRCPDRDEFDHEQVHRKILGANVGICELSRACLGSWDLNLKSSDRRTGHETLNIVSPDSALLIGKHGDRLDDIQYLVNRIARNAFEDAPRYRIDCDGYRAEQEQRVADKALRLADKVRETGRELWMNPMNSTIAAWFTMPCSKWRTSRASPRTTVLGTKRSLSGSSSPGPWNPPPRSPGGS